MKLYHGTSAAYLESILKHGLRPRRKQKSNWDEYPSRPDMVYLTTAYAPYFAYAHDLGNPLIVEIDTKQLPQGGFMPDEDFVQEALRQSGDVQANKRIVASLEDYQSYWEMSVAKMGTCAFKGRIPPQTITRYCTWDEEVLPHLSMFVGDPVISTGNYSMCSEKYIAFTQWLFGDRPDIPPDEFPVNAKADNIGDECSSEEREQFEKLQEYITRHLGEREQMSAMRVSIEVVTLQTIAAGQN
jgi:hypothetical protein